MLSAEATLGLAKKLGIKANLLQVYNKETAERLALITATMRTILEDAIKEPITVSKE